MLYPQTANWFNTLNQNQQIRQYQKDVKTIGPEGRLRALELAHAYNHALVSGAAVQANHRIPVAQGARLPAGFDYSTLLDANPYGLMGRIIIPVIGVDLPIYHGTSDAVLAEGIGHLEGSSLPVGGPGTHSVLAGHRGLASSVLFTNLNKVTVGDTFTLSVFGETLTYRVIDTRVVNPDETRELDPVPGKDLVTLVTCTPIGINSQRILVTGQRVLPPPAKAAKAAHAVPSGPGFPWWVLILLLSLVVMTFYVWWSGKPIKRARH